MFSYIRALGIAWLLAGSCSLLRADELTPQAIEFFESRIRPVLVNECYECHSSKGDTIEGELTLDSPTGLRRGGTRGPAIIPNDPSSSLLLTALSHAEIDLQMPPDKKLSADIIADFRSWIAMGAPDPRKESTEASHHYEIDFTAGRQHWAFQPIAQPPIPSVNQTIWPRKDLDFFILHSLEQEQLSPNEDAPPLTLLRRIYFDLIGLPPTQNEIEAFLADPSEQTLEQTVDRLLESPRFGEKWARHWLDVARYAESTGGTVNFYYPHAWRYRDYVISAFNHNKPFDTFIKEQLAGDLMKSADPQIRSERMVATGFLALGTKTLNERSGLKHELDIVDEQINVTTQALLGLTVACARCHDHKFDPFSQTDYYALAGIFRSTETCYGTLRYINAQRPSPLLNLPKDANIPLAVDNLPDSRRQRIEEQIASIRESIRNMRDPIQQFLTSGRVSLLEAQLAPFEQDGTPKYLAMGVRDKQARPPFGRRNFAFGTGANRYTYDGSLSIADSPVFIRGEADQPETTNVPRGVPQVFTTTSPHIPRFRSGRLELAAWITERENPLTARVAVNRFWLQLFGQGLVPSANDFGMAGQPPTHPALLDHLATRFVENNWNIKDFIRYLVLSRTYRLNSKSSPAAQAVDPDNRLYWRMVPRRLDAETLRDAMLAVSGQLETVPPKGSLVAKQGEGPVDRFGFVPLADAIDDPKNIYRSIYLPVIRDNLPQSMALFDAADPALIVPQRQQTTVPAQALYLLNGDFVQRASDATAKQLILIEDPRHRIDTAFLTFYGRPTTEEEFELVTTFLATYQQSAEPQPDRLIPADFPAWSALCQSMFASAEFLYRK